MNSIKTFLTIAVPLVIFSCAPEPQFDSPGDETSTTQHYQGPQEAVFGEYILVFKDDDHLAVSNSIETTDIDTRYSEIKNKLKAKARSVLSVISNEQPIDHLFTSTFQGFLAKGLTEEDIQIIGEDSRVAQIIPNYVYRQTTPKHKSIAKQSEFIQTSLGDYIHINAKKVGAYNVDGRTERIFIIGDGISRGVWNQLNIDYGAAHSVIPNKLWSEDLYKDGSAHALFIAAKADGRYALGMAAGARVVPVKARHDFQIQLQHLLEAIEYTYNTATTDDIFVYSTGGFYGNEPHHPIVKRAFTLLAGKMRGAIAPVSEYSTPSSTYGLFPYDINLSKLWVCGLADFNFTPYANAAYGPNINTWAPAVDAGVFYLPGTSYGWHNIPSVAASMTAAVLYVRGNNTIGNQGQVTYYGYTAPKLKLN